MCTHNTLAGVCLLQIKTVVEVYDVPNFTKEIIGGTVGGLVLLALITAGLVKVREPNGPQSSCPPGQHRPWAGLESCVMGDLSCPRVSTDPGLGWSHVSWEIYELLIQLVHYLWVCCCCCCCF